MSTRAASTHDPSRSSYYIDSAFYDRLVAQFTDWQRDDRLVGDSSVRDACTAVIVREARLLDDRRFDAWLALFVPECVYWVPSSPGGDPRREVAVCFDDRRQLEGRVYRLGTGAAWAQVPSSRTARIAGNCEVFATEAHDEWMVRSSLILTEHRAGATRVLSGWCGHRLKRTDSGWRIAVKQVNLLECDQHLHNPSVML